MRAKQFNQIIKTYLLPEFPGYVTSNRGDIIAVPMNHLWRGFVFAPCSVPELCFLSYNVMPLYFPADVLYTGIGNRLLEGNSDSWEWNEANAEQIAKRMLVAMKRVESEILDKFKSPLDFGTVGPQLYGWEGWNHLEKFAYSLIYADRFEEAVPMLVELIGRLERQRPELNGVKSQMQIRCETILNLKKADPARAKAQLLEWEQQTIKELKLEKYPN